MFGKGSSIEQMSVETLQELMENDADFVLLDVREPDEFAFCRLEGSILIPLAELQKRVSELDPHRKTVVICRSGGRSNVAASLLKQHGFEDIANIAGGILAWSDRIDPSVPKY